MVNIASSILVMFLGCGEVILNKGSPNGNFIYLMTLLSLWLFVYTVVVNKCHVWGLMALLNTCLTGIVILALKTSSLLLFYVFFEFSIVPIAMIVYLYGYQPEKLQASLFLLLYTVAGSLPLLLFIILGNFMIIGSLLSIPITLGFMIKTPMYLLHSWLPKAHLEAPVGGSMVLAGVLLKLGAYGLLLFLPLVKMNHLLCFYFGMALLGSSLSALVCLRQGDMKLLIAYSSVVHMGVVILGFISATELGYSCGLMMVLAHGLSSPFMFAYSFWLYSTSHSRQLLNNSASAVSAGMLLGLVALNMSVPPSLSLWSEVLMTIGTLFLNGWMVTALIAVFFLGAVYNLYLFTSCVHAKYSSPSSMEAASVYPVLQVVFCSFMSFVCLDLFHVFWYSAF